MSRRRNGTNRAAARLGLSMYGPMNTGKKKRPKEMVTPMGTCKINHKMILSDAGEQVKNR